MAAEPLTPDPFSSLGRAVHADKRTTRRPSMKARIDKIITFSILAVVALVYGGYDVFAVCGVTPKLLGLLLGLGGGFASVMLEEANRVLNWRRLTVRVFSICLSPAGFILLVPITALLAGRGSVPAQLGVGYVIGAAVTYFAGSAIQSLGEGATAASPPDGGAEKGS